MEQQVFAYAAPFSYDASPWPMRADLIEAHQIAWKSLAAPGTWWTGAERVALAAQVRAALDCAVCAERKEALSPYSVATEHTADSLLPRAAVDAVHRLSSDPARLSQKIVEDTIAAGLTDGHYVELLSIVIMLSSIDRVHLALGLDLEPLPKPEAGESTQYRPAKAVIDVGWVPMLTLGKTRKSAEADLFEGMPIAPNVIRALSLVPNAVRELRNLNNGHYMNEVDVGNPSANGGRALERRFIELVGARTSALNECFY
jgi:hypothetical protein